MQGQAQSPIYNQSGNGSSAIFNAPSNSSGAGGPLSLNQLLRGTPNSSSSNAVGSSASSLYYGGVNSRPYGIDGGNYSLSLSPEAIKNSRARRDQLAQERYQDVLAAIDGSRFISPEGSEEEQNSLLPNSAIGSSQQRQIQPQYKQRDDNFEIPKKVFNSIY